MVDIKLIKEVSKEIGTKRLVSELNLELTRLRTVESFDDISEFQNYAQISRVFEGLTMDDLVSYRLSINAWCESNNVSTPKSNIYEFAKYAKSHKLHLQDMQELLNKPAF